MHVRNTLQCDVCFSHYLTKPIFQIVRRNSWASLKNKKGLLMLSITCLFLNIFSVLLFFFSFLSFVFGSFKKGVTKEVGQWHFVVCFEVVEFSRLCAHGVWIAGCSPGSSLSAYPHIKVIMGSLFKSWL
jgi:hypothetical protein